MKPQREAFGLPNHETHVERQLSSINYKFRILVWIHVVGFVSGLITTICVSVIASRYWGQVAAVLTPDSLASATNGVLVTIGNAANISTDVAFFSDGARLAFAPSDAAQAVVVGRRALQGLGPDAQAALAALLTAMTAKVEAADVNAPAEFLRFVMGLPWKEDIAPRVDRGLASVQYAEVLAGAALAALSAANETARGLLMPPRHFLQNSLS